MTIKSILVHLDATRRSGMRLELARELGVRCEGVVTGLFAMTPYALMVPALYSPEAIEMLQDIDDEYRERARSTFDAACATTGCKVAWAELKGVSPTECVIQQSRYADLVVLGQRDPDDPLSDALPLDFVETVLLQSGRPTLVLPYAIPVRSNPRRVIVGWNGSRESARALKAALPLIRQAEHVHVLSFGAEKTSVAGESLDIERYLSMYGIDARVDVSAERNLDVGNTLLNAVMDDSSDLLVMGCYGHSKAREWVMGGATRTVLQSMTVQVLMSH